MRNAAIPEPKKKFTWLYDLLLIVVLAAAAYFRFTGSNWGELNIQHPDANFITSVTLAIQPVHSLADYFNTAKSTLNPAAVGYPAYVYGTLPLFIVRYLAQWTGQMNNVALFGRQLSGVADLGTIALLYFIVKRLYKQRVALLAAAFSALAVMQIQQSHFYTTDNFVTFFMFLTLYFAVLIATGTWRELDDQPETPSGKIRSGSNASRYLLNLWRDPLILQTVGFGLALGMAAASKLNAVVLAVLLPIALAIRYFSTHRQAIQDATPEDEWAGISPFEDFVFKAFIFLVIGAVLSLLAFRIFQPYAFSGPGFFNLKPDPTWMQKIQEQLRQASPNSDLPWDLQWARRTHLYSFQNLTVWGLGLPLGILAWAGFLWMGWRMLKGEWRRHLLLWIWTACYFLWQSLQYNPTMRYQLPIYPLLAMMAAWAIFDWASPRISGLRRFNWRLVLSVTVGASVLALTFCWAYAFSRIYVHPESRIAASDWIFQHVPGPINLRIQTAGGTVYEEPVPFSSYGGAITSELPYTTSFVAQASGILSQVVLGHVADRDILATTQTLGITLIDIQGAGSNQPVANGSVTANFSPKADSRGGSFTFDLSPLVPLKKGSTYVLSISTTGGMLTLSGSNVINETDYDYPLPFRAAGYDPFGGIYPGGLYLQVYWDDNADKLKHLLATLDQGDYIFIPTNHQYAQITRIPERYPLTTVYYRQLLGCPPDKNIIWCYRTAEPGMFKGDLGFDLVATFEDYPTIGSLVINDQSAEEAFTFYDHPKVLVFKKNADYNPVRVQAILGSVDISTAVHLTPGQADNYKSLMIPADQLTVQQAGGTWSDLFNRNAFYNRYPGLGIVIWYLVIFALGVFTYPLVRAALPGLADHGYPLARIVGLLLWAWFAWIAGSFGLTYSKITIAAALGLIILIGVWQAWRQRDELKQEFRERWKYFLMVEVVFLSFFLIDLLIRLGNPDLWHPSKGGERPMDFAYLNAILKSTSFPPYDPWFSGGYINYYYYGYVIVGTPVKLLGIVPSIAYNFILPTLFACLAAAAFSVGWNLLAGVRKLKIENRDGLHPPDPELQSTNSPPRFSLFDSRFIGGISASSAMVLLGNLGVVRMLYQGFQQAGAPGGLIGKANILQRIGWTFKGFFMILAGLHLPYGPGDWYWFPSRALPDTSGSPITEFPLFTFIYSDLHAHMIALMITVLAIAWTLSVLMAKARWKNHLDTAFGLFLGGLVIGALRPTNTWDFYTYLILGVVVLAYAVYRYADVSRFLPGVPEWGKRLALTIGAVAALVAVSLVLYQPFTHAFLLDPSYTKVYPWTGGRSNISSYLVHWGVFLFFIFSWMVWETRQWLAETPVSALRKLRPYRDLIIAGLVILFLVLVLQQAWVMSSTQNVPWGGITILWLALPLAVWAAILIFRPGISDGKRLVMFMVGTALLLTMVVEFIVLGGDIGRMNTVFKLYNQAWVLLGISAAACFAWLLGEIRKWLLGWWVGWQVVGTALIAGAALFLLMGGMGKIDDRMASNTPHTLDSMTYMAYSTYAEFGVNLNLSEDYRAIRWMQDNVKGSPVIVEAAPAGVQYAWLGRFSIYTGLPDVVGWEWHQMQQRVMSSNIVRARGVEMDAFYTTTEPMAAEDFLRKYNVRYIIVGQLERAKYTPGGMANPPLLNPTVPADAPNGLDKFESFDGILWNEVYRDGQTVIYEVPVKGGVLP